MPRFTVHFHSVQKKKHLLFFQIVPDSLCVKNINTFDRTPLTLVQVHAYTYRTLAGLSEPQTLAD